MTTESRELTKIQPLLEIRTFYYDLLRRAFREEPSESFLEQLTQVGETTFPLVEENDLLAEGVQEVMDVLRMMDLKEEVESLHWDYTRMFIGPLTPLPVPIWESAYRNKDGLLFQNETLAVRLAYLKHAFLPHQLGKEADDHLGLELDFMYQLSLASEEQYQAGDVETFFATLSDQELFLHEHFKKWIPLFTENVLKEANTEFYRGMVKILQGFLQLDEQGLEDLMAIKNEIS